MNELGVETKRNKRTSTGCQWHIARTVRVHPVFIFLVATQVEENNVTLMDGVGLACASSAQASPASLPKYPLVSHKTSQVRVIHSSIIHSLTHFCQGQKKTGIFQGR